MVRMSDVGDRTVDVLKGRAGILAGIALLTLVLPAIVAGALGNVVPLTDPFVVLVPVVRFAVLALLLLGMLAVTAVASDPAVDQSLALRIAVRRLPAALGLLVALVLMAVVLFIPAGALLALSGATLTAAGTLDMTRATSGYAAGAGLSVVLAVVLGLWFSARIVPLFAIVVNERRGFGALRRSLALTRGATLRLIGVLILYFLVLTVTMLAVTSVVGVVARLVLGAEAAVAARFVVAVASALLSAAATVVQSVFYARFYVAAFEQEQHRTPLA